MRSIRAKLDKIEGRWLATALILSGLFIHDWDGFVFRTAIEELWAGKSPYRFGNDPVWYTLLGPYATEPQWWAYPPLLLILMLLTSIPSLLISFPPILERILLKLPLVLGQLFLARFVGSWFESQGKNGRGIHRAILWSPSFLLIGPIWGMGDVLMMGLVLGSLWAWEQEKWRTMGILLGLAILVKPFPIFLAIPLLVVFWNERRSLRTWVTALGWAVLTMVLISAPFAYGNVSSFIEQVAGNHALRDAQGFTLWRLVALLGISSDAIRLGSTLSLLGGIIVAAYLARSAKGTEGRWRVTLQAAALFLLTNRVVNEQYIAMALVPLLVLAHWSDRFHLMAKVLDRVLAATIILVGFHFLTFIPPDVALLVLRRPVDEIAGGLRALAPWFWNAVPYVLLGLLVGTLVRILAISSYLDETKIPRPEQGLQGTLGAGFVALLIVLTPTLAATPDAEEPIHFEPALDGPKVLAYHYLWWHNPSHDPDIRYGNWLVVSQDPEVGFYTNNLGLSRIQAQQMVENGIDTAIISYHRGELPRYEIFQRAAMEEGLWTTPLIELNQVYDEEVDGAFPHRPINERGEPAVYAAYRLDEETRKAFVDFVLDLREQIQAPNAARVDGEPMLMFYDAYVSGVSFHEEDKRQLAESLLRLYEDRWDVLEANFNRTVAPTVEALYELHPTNYSSFFENPAMAIWREAHLVLHDEFWAKIMADVEAELGPLYWVAGDSFNERAGFEAGVIQSIRQLDYFDGSFIYSPSFAWGTNQDKSELEIFEVYKDRNIWLTAFASGLNRDSMVGIAPAYDDTVNRPDIGFVIPPTLNGENFYDLSWASMRSNPPTMVGLATWNEYFEGSSLEPSVEFGSKPLNQTASWRGNFTSWEIDPSPLRVVVHETSSRLSLQSPDLDEPHGWGLDLVASLGRHDRVLAMDAMQGVIPDGDSFWIDGGYHHYGVASPILDALEDNPWLVFGRNPPPSIQERFDPRCTDSVQFVPTEWLGVNATLRTEGATLRLDLGEYSRVVGQSGCEHVTIRPYHQADRHAGVACMEVVLSWQEGTTDSCTWRVPDSIHF